MTRINVVPVSELTDKHLRGEFHEISRVFKLVNDRVEKNHTPVTCDIPKEYAMGTGHVKFFYDKLRFISTRYQDLFDELVKRGGRPDQFLVNLILLAARNNIPNSFWNDYEPTEQALEINRQRISERLFPEEY